MRQSTFVNSRGVKRLARSIRGRAVARAGATFPGVCAVLAVLWLGLVPIGCRRTDPTPASMPAGKPTTMPAEPELPPTYTFAAGLREQSAEVSDFVRQFMETCLAGDYAGYRLLVSRGREPESEDRFRVIYRAIDRVHVESIEPVEVFDLPPPVYLVISSVEFRTGQQVSFRQGSNRDISILVFREDGDWRMLPAPASLQPGHETPPPATTSAPAESPDYPWQTGIDD